MHSTLLMAFPSQLLGAGCIVDATLRYPRALYCPVQVGAKRGSMPFEAASAGKVQGGGRGGARRHDAGRGWGAGAPPECPPPRAAAPPLASPAPSQRRTKRTREAALTVTDARPSQRLQDHLRGALLKATALLAVTDAARSLVSEPAILVPGRAGPPAATPARQDWP